jgi:hypothetical protein
VLAANQRPDFRTISDFRTQHLAALTTLFVQVLRPVSFRIDVACASANKATVRPAH